ncbi:LAMI_0G16512g1_1 [Lachancea mirantina]|uniref:LAMI_0G16512g1_1 n=1 Tax=Lachancea mirantina TaxID=1230905 RepID=A0A1G4KCS4_9SACH|nr:LAMI_0G16512g1_1 [Lachancea mirantina]
MSVCLAITKTLAVSSLGIYAGVLATATTMVFTTPKEILLKQSCAKTEASKAAVGWPTVRAIMRLAAAAGASSVLFFGLSYFGAPPVWRHPYLLYGMLVAPLSGCYSLLSSACHGKKCSRAKTGATCPAKKCPVPHATPAAPASAPGSSLEDSVVDLGAPAEPAGPAAPHPVPIATQDSAPARTTSACTVRIHLSVMTSLALIGFVQSVFGVYGEGLFV